MIGFASSASLSLFSRGLPNALRCSTNRSLKINTLYAPTRRIEDVTTNNTSIRREFKSTTPLKMGADDHLKEGDKVPSIIFKTRKRIAELEGKVENPFDWVDTSSEEIFKGKRVVIFALPGAFTPTCSSTHVPGYEADYDEITSKGIDEIYCLSVNDAFVMFQWGLKQNAKKVKMLPDGACLFTRGMGMSCTWTTERGFGERSWRYSMIVNDGVIEKMFIEPGFAQNSGPDPFEVSDSKTMLNYLAKAPVSS